MYNYPKEKNAWKMSIHLAQLTQWKMHRIDRYRNNSAFPVTILLIEIFRKTTQNQTTANSFFIACFLYLGHFFSAIFFFGFVRTTSGKPSNAKTKGKRNQKVIERYRKAKNETRNKWRWEFFFKLKEVIMMQRWRKRNNQ